MIPAAALAGGRALLAARATAFWPRPAGCWDDARAAGPRCCPRCTAPRSPTRSAAAEARSAATTCPRTCPHRTALADALADDVGAVIWHHPFGYYLPPPSLDGPVVLEDACFTLNTMLAMPGLPAPELIVFSPRKLFGWPDGGVTIGRRTAAVGASVGAASADLAARWRAVDLPGERDRAAAASRHARAELGDRLPPAAACEQVLTALPLLASGRNEVIEVLRAGGVGAWHWQRPMRGCTPETTPRAWSLWLRLLLVPVPEAGSPAYRLLGSPAYRLLGSPAYRLLGSLPLESSRVP